MSGRAERAARRMRQGPGLGQTVDGAAGRAAGRALRQGAGALALALTLGCGQVAGTAAGLMGGSGPGGPAPENMPGFTGAEIAAAPDAYLAFEARSIGVAGLGLRAGTNAGRETFIGQTGYSVTLQDGVVVATRGLGDDLMAADVSEVVAALAAGGGTARRLHETLDSRDRIVARSFDCTIAAAEPEMVALPTRQVPALRFEENCTGSAVAFTNLYWLDAAGRIVQSRQLVSPTVAYLRSGRL